MQSILTNDISHDLNDFRNSNKCECGKLVERLGLVVQVYLYYAPLDRIMNLLNDRDQRAERQKYAAKVDVLHLLSAPSKGHGFDRSLTVPSVAGAKEKDGEAEACNEADNRGNEHGNRDAYGALWYGIRHGAASLAEPVRRTDISAAP